MGVARTLADFLDRGEEGMLGILFRRITLGSLLKAQAGPATLSSALVVYADESTAVPGRVRSVYATAGGTPGGKLVVPHGGGITPATGECSLEVDEDGNTIVHFAAADAVTACRVEYEAVATPLAELNADFRG